MCTLLYILDVIYTSLCHFEFYLFNLPGLQCGWTNSQRVAKRWIGFGTSWKSEIGLSPSPTCHEFMLKYLFISGRYSRDSQLSLHIMEWAYTMNLYGTQNQKPYEVHPNCCLTWLQAQGQTEQSLKNRSKRQMVDIISVLSKLVRHPTTSKRISNSINIPQRYLNFKQVTECH